MRRAGYGGVQIPGLRTRLGRHALVQYLCAITFAPFQKATMKIHPPTVPPIPARFALHAARAAWVCTFALSCATAADLSVEISGHRSTDGKVRVALYKDSTSFPGTPLRGIEGPASQGTVVLTFKEVPPGAYALSAYHDENGNEKMDRGLFNIPSERYGFSGDARADKGPPEFRAAQVEVRDPATKISIKLR